MTGRQRLEKRLRDPPSAFIYTQCPEKANLWSQKASWWLPRTKEKEWLLNGCGISFWGSENVFKPDRDGGCTILWLCWRLLNCPLGFYAMRLSLKLKKKWRRNKDFLRPDQKKIERHSCQETCLTRKFKSFRDKENNKGQNLSST